MPQNKRIIALVIFGILIAVLALFLPEIVFTPKIYINASNITAVGAASTSGGIANISEINTGNYSLVESTTPWYVNITFTGITNFTYLETKSMYFATTGAPTAHEVDIEIWCETEGEFIDLHSLTSHLEWTYFTRNFPDSMHFIDPAGNVTVRFNHSDNGNTQHRLYIDTVRLITDTQYEQNIVYLNQTISGGSGCVGDCDFNNLSVNIISKNDTLGGTFPSSITLKSPLIAGTSQQYSVLDLDAGVSFDLFNTNVTNDSTGHVFGQDGLFFISVGNGTETKLSVLRTYIDFMINSNRIYRMNTTHFDMGGANLTNCSNCNADLSTKVNKTGDLLNFTGNTRFNLSNNGSILGAYDTWAHPLGISFTFFSSNRFQTKEAAGWQNLTYSNRKGGTIVWADDAYTYYTFAANSTTPVAQFAIDSTGVYDYNLSGGAGLVYVDDNGQLRKVAAPTGTGNIYTCWNKSLKQPFYGTPGC